MGRVSDLPDRYSQGDNKISVWALTVDVAIANNSWVNRIESPVTVPMGILRRVIIKFPDGCQDHIRVLLYSCNTGGGASSILYPENTVLDGSMYFSGNDYIFDFQAFKVIPTGKDIVLVGWNDGSSSVNWTHPITAYCHMEQVGVP